MKFNMRCMIKAMVYMGVGVGYFAVGYAAGGTVDTPTPGTLGTMANNILNSFPAVGNLMSAFSYLLGLFFSVNGFTKIKQHKDAATQVPLHQGLSLLALGIGLIALPSLIGTLSKTAFNNPQTFGSQGGGCSTAGDITNCLNTQ